jgi:tetratricopeptide (TPR) repeat protein
MATKGLEQDREQGMPFVGREQELDRIRVLVKTPGDPWLLWVIAPAGVGKSRLLEAVLKEFATPKYRSSGLFDFFTDGLRTGDGILVELAKRFEVYDGRFAEEHIAYQRAMKANDAATRAYALRRMEAELVDALKARFTAVKRGLIVADTVELIAESPVGRWFFADLLPQLAPHVAVIAAGRRLPQRANDALRESGAAEALELRGLRPAAVGDLLEWRLPGQFVARDDQAFVKHLHRIASDVEPTPGRDDTAVALLVDLVAYRLNPHSKPKLGDTLRRQDVMAFDAEKLRERVVDEVMTGGSVQGQVVFWMTHAGHGFDKAMLRELFSPEELETKDYKGFLEGLHPLPFVKYHKDADVVRVHDYFRDRARDKIWPGQDPDSYTRKNKISEKLAAYFESRLKELPPDAVSPERDRLTHQWLYHLLFADRKKAYAELWQTLDKAWHNGRFDFMNDLLAMMDEVDRIAPTPKHQPQILRRMIEAVTAWAQQENWDIPRGAIAKLADRVIKDVAIPSRLRFSAMVAKGMALGDTSRTDEANKSLRTALKGYDRLLEAADSDTQEAQEMWEAEMGIATVEGIRPERYLILNTIGYNERARGAFDAALKAFRQSYKLSLAEGDERWQASAATQIGTVLRYKGDTPDARDWIKKGMAIRQKLGARNQIGFSRLALGQLHRDMQHLDDARESFNKANAIFSETDSVRDVAATWTELGWVETLAKDYAKAEACFKLAIQTAPHLAGASLREKYGKMLLRKALEMVDGPEKRDLLDRADEMLRQGVEISGDLDRQLYAALCMAALIRLADVRGDEAALNEWAGRLSALRSQDYPFDWAYADMEEVFFNRARSKAIRPDRTYDQALIHEAAAHFLKMFAHLARHSPILYRNKRDDLSDWLNTLPDPLKRDIGRWMIQAWEGQPNKLAKSHPGFIRTVKIACDID